MKIRVINKSYEEVMRMPQYVHKKPIHQLGILRPILKALCWFLLLLNGFTYEKIGMDKLKKGEPCLVLMNHSSFIDLEIAANILFPRPFHIVATTDGFVGKNWLMRQIGCIPTKKFSPGAKNSSNQMAISRHSGFL